MIRRDWVGMDANGRPVRGPSWRVRAVAVVRGWPGLFVTPALAGVVARLGVEAGVPWAPLVALLFTILAAYQVGLVILADLIEEGPVARREFYRRVRLPIVAILELVVLTVLVVSTLAGPVEPALPGVWLAIAVLAAGTFWDVRLAWRAWVYSP